MNIVLFGAGYVGLCFGVVLSSCSNVTLVDIDERKVSLINKGQSPISENELVSLLQSAVENGRLRATSPDSLPDQIDIFVICVDTPVAHDGSTDLSRLTNVLDVIERKLRHMNKNKVLIVIRSTVPPGTSRAVLERFRKAFPEMTISIIFQPEFLRQGMAIHDLLEPDRIIIGTADSEVSTSDLAAIEQWISILKTLLRKKDTPIIRMSMESAELCKYVANCFLATKVSFVNEIATIAERVPGVNIDDVIRGVVQDHRIHPSHMRPGLGFGGSCLPKDLSGLVSFAHQVGVSVELLEAVKRVNERVTERLLQIMPRPVSEYSGRKVSILGVAFKAGTDDARSSPSLELIRQLENAGAIVFVHDPAVDLERLRVQGGYRYKISKNVTECVSDSELLFIMTDWPEYSAMGLARIVDLMRVRAVVDGRRMFVNAERPADIYYHALGMYVPR